MDESEWLTRKTRIDAGLRSLRPARRIVPWTDDLEPSRLDCHAVTEFPIANRPTDYVLWVNGLLHGIAESKRVSVGPQNVPEHAKRYAMGAGDGAENWDGYKVPFLFTAQHFAEFEKAYGKDPNGLSRRSEVGLANRFKKFSISKIKERGYKLDITRLEDESLGDSDELPEPLACIFHTRSAELHSAVWQNCILRAADDSERPEPADTMPIINRLYGRLKICATLRRDAAEASPTLSTVDQV